MRKTDANDGVLRDHYYVAGERWGKGEAVFDEVKTPWCWFEGMVNTTRYSAVGVACSDSEETPAV